MGRQNNIRLTRRDMLKLGAGGAGMFMISAGGLAIPKGFAGGGGGGGGGSLYIEAFPTSPLILKPFNDPLAIPPALRPKDPMTWDSSGGLPDPKNQDSMGASPTKDYYNKYGQTLGEHQLWPGDGPTAPSPSSQFNWLSTTPLVYQLKVQAAAPLVHELDGAADQQLRPEREPARSPERERTVPAQEHDLGLQRA